MYCIFHIQAYSNYLQAMNNLISKLEKVDARKMFDVPKIKRSCLKSWSNWIGWLLSWLFSFCEGRDCREDGKSRNTAARLVGGLILWQISNVILFVGPNCRFFLTKPKICRIITKKREKTLFWKSARIKHIPEFPPHCIVQNSEFTGREGFTQGSTNKVTFFT